MKPKETIVKIEKSETEDDKYTISVTHISPDPKKWSTNTTYIHIDWETLDKLQEEINLFKELR